MSREHLLEAIGLLDDDLIREAEEYRRSRRNYRPWISLAACLVVVLALGYGVTRLRTVGEMSGGASQNTTATPSASCGLDAASGEVFPGDMPFDMEGESQAGNSAPSESEEPTSPGAPNPEGDVLLVSVYLDGNWCRFTHVYNRDPVLEALPEGCVSLGQAERQHESAAAPWTDGDRYLGCEVWLLPGGEPGETLIYLERPEGDYLECR